MRTHKKTSFKNYRLISAYIKIDKDKQEDEIQNKIMAQRFKAFHVFCIVLFSSFIVDGVLPYKVKPGVITGLKTLFSDYKTITTKSGDKTLVLSSMVEIYTNHGNFITTDITGFNLHGKKVLITKTRIFSVAQNIRIPNIDQTITRYFNFHGNFIFWPLLALLLSVIGVFYKKAEGSTTLSVLSILNIIPFFITVYMT